ncbi:hypothetical protein BLNAU_10107 [Blattamonas nauphoetae]|uniref:Uncharacterized protein n=1 Tax=Blattamonas nauphoetae TaxID=2049346 RepID=A0ABQ9XU11_9EUKA|nr:hypothetical protein BLNAU_10107 [Blattamonas nauphoetae]
MMSQIDKAMSTKKNWRIKGAFKADCEAAIPAIVSASTSKCFDILPRIIDNATDIVGSNRCDLFDTTPLFTYLQAYVFSPKHRSMRSMMLRLIEIFINYPKFFSRFTRSVQMGHVIQFISIEFATLKDVQSLSMSLCLLSHCCEDEIVIFKMIERRIPSVIFSLLSGLETKTLQLAPSCLSVLAQLAKYPTLTETVYQTTGFSVIVSLFDFKPLEQKIWQPLLLLTKQLLGTDSHDSPILHSMQDTLFSLVWNTIDAILIEQPLRIQHLFFCLNAIAETDHTACSDILYEKDYAERILRLNSTLLTLLDDPSLELSDAPHLFTSLFQSIQTFAKAPNMEPFALVCVSSDFGGLVTSLLKHFPILPSASLAALAETLTFIFLNEILVEILLSLSFIEECYSLLTSTNIDPIHSAAMLRIIDEYHTHTAHPTASFSSESIPTILSCCERLENHPTLVTSALALLSSQRIFVDRITEFSMDDRTRLTSCCLAALNHSIDRLSPQSRTPTQSSSSYTTSDARQDIAGIVTFLPALITSRSALHLILLTCPVHGIAQLFSSSEAPLTRYDAAVISMLSAVADAVRHHQPSIPPSEQISFFGPLLANSTLNSLFALSSRAKGHNSPSLEKLTNIIDHLTIFIHFSTRTICLLA